MKVDSKNTALVVTDPQNDFLSPEGVTWGMVERTLRKIILWKILSLYLRLPKKTASRFSYRLITITPPIMVGNLRALWRKPCMTLICLIARVR